MTNEIPKQTPYTRRKDVPERINRLLEIRKGTPFYKEGMKNKLISKQTEEDSKNTYKRASKECYFIPLNITYDGLRKKWKNSEAFQAATGYAKALFDKANISPDGLGKYFVFTKSPTLKKTRCYIKAFLIFQDLHEEDIYKLIQTWAFTDKDGKPEHLPLVDSKTPLLRSPSINPLHNTNNTNNIFTDANNDFSEVQEENTDEESKWTNSANYTNNSFPITNNLLPEHVSSETLEETPALNNNQIPRNDTITSTTPFLNSGDSNDSPLLFHLKSGSSIFAPTPVRIKYPDSLPNDTLSSIYGKKRKLNEENTSNKKPRL